MSLKKKTFNGLLWSFIENFSRQSINFIIGVILARLLLPKEFGLIGMITVFIAISTSIINSGFSQALIRKKNCTNVDYSTVFYFNLIISATLTISLFLCAPLIANFYSEPLLVDIVHALSLVLFIDAFSIIQRTILVKRVDFKLQTKISVIADVLSGILAIILAYKGFGVWSLVVLQLTSRLLNTILLWSWNKWLPIWSFNLSSFKELFDFGYKLMLSGILNTVFNNIYLIIIGKYFSAAQLGFYTRADQFKSLPSQNVSGIIQRVTFPILSEMQDDIPRLKRNYRKIIRGSMIVTFIMMLVLAAIAEPLILTLIGEKWYQSIIYLQLLCFVGMLYPLHSLNLNMLTVQGRSGLFLKIAIIKKILQVPVIIIAIFYGIKIMIICMIINSVIAFFINSKWSGKFIGYSTGDQIKDLAPSFIFAFVIAISVYGIGVLLQLNNLMTLIIQLSSSILITIVLGEVFKVKDYKLLKNIGLDIINKRI